MLAVMPISSPKRYAVPRPIVPGAPAVTRADVGILALIGAIVLALVAPPSVLAVAIVAGVFAVVAIVLTAAGPVPERLAEAHQKAAALALVSNYSLSR